MLSSSTKAHLVIVDVQERLAPAVSDHETVIANVIRLIRYAQHLGVPITVTEHYPRGIGHTAAPVTRALAEGSVAVLEKITFSGWRTPAIRARIADQARDGRSQIVVAGMEGHVCVMQTALDCLAAGFELIAVADAIGSRTPANRDIALRRIERAGGVVASQEMIAFEWMERGDHPAFRDILGLLK